MADIQEEDDLSMIEPTPATKSNLDLINECDNFPYPDTDPKGYTSHISTYYHLFIPPCPHALGYLLPSVALTLQGIPGWSISEEDRTLTLDLPSLSVSEQLFTAPTSDPASAADDYSTETDEDLTALSSSTNDPVPAPNDPSSISSSTGVQSSPTQLEQARTQILAKTTAAMRATDHFAVLRKWRNELYPIYWRDPSFPGRKTLLASIERSASGLFGVVTYGVHMTAYTRGGSDDPGDMQIWVPRRARTKETYPGLLDQTVAGGISTGESAFESLVRESEEEASLPEELIRRKARAAGAVTYFYIRGSRAGGETGLLQPECQFVYDLDLTGEVDPGGVSVEPKVGDEKEVEGFELMGVGEVRRALGEGTFKPNCAVVSLDFLVRQGVLTRENEGDFVEVCQRVRRRLEFPCL